jgi:hypothetical protein
MKNKLLSFGIVGLTGVLLSSFMLAQKGDEIQEPKKSRHIKLTKIENGKKMELDTAFTNENVFVWQGDTVNPPKHAVKYSSSGSDKMQQVDVKVDRKDGKEKVMIIKHRGGKSGEPMILNMDSGDDMEIVTEDIDSNGKHIVVRKRMKDGVEDHMSFRNGDFDMLVPPPPPQPVPPMPPFPHMKVMKMQHAGQIIDLNDPNIVSYKKKDVKGGLEKIEIIRKKSENQENMTFDFNDDYELMAPEPPEAPEFNWESDGDSIHLKVIEKRKVIKGKEGKEIEVKVETEENK